MGRVPPHRFGPDLPPEERFLLALAKLDPSQEDWDVAHDLLTNTNYPWRRTIALAVAHRVHPMLAYNLDSKPSFKSLVPDEFQKVLRASRVAAVMRRELYRQTISPILESLEVERIRPVLLKGAALLETIFPRGTRLLNDFDLLIDKRDYDKVTAAFVKAGFSKRFRKEKTEAEELENYHQVGLVKGAGESLLSVDLHWLLYPADRPFCQIDTHTLVSRSRGIAFGATRVLVVSPEDMLVHYASQILNDSLDMSYQRMGDIYAIAKSLPSWESTIEIACRAGSAGAMHLALSVASMLGARVPSWTFRELRSACAGCHVPSQRLVVPSLAFRGRTTPQELPILVSLLYSRQWDRIRYLRLFVASRWQVSRRYRGTLRSWLLVVRRIAQASRLSVTLLATHLPRWHSAWSARRLESNRL